MGLISAVGIKRIVYADTSVVNKDITADFAKTLIKADEQVTEREHQFYKLMKTIWKLD